MFPLFQACKWLETSTMPTSYSFKNSKMSICRVDSNTQLSKEGNTLFSSRAEIYGQGRYGDNYKSLAVCQCVEDFPRKQEGWVYATAGCREKDSDYRYYLCTKQQFRSHYSVLEESLGGASKRIPARAPVVLFRDFHEGNDRETWRGIIRRYGLPDLKWVVLCYRTSVLDMGWR